MSGSLRLNGSTSGFSEITAPDVAGDQTFTLPAVGGTLSTSTVVYQQGLWVPTSRQGTLTVNADRCVWTRVGNLVTVWCNITEFSNRTSADAITITGLPYVGVDQAATGSCMWQRVNNGPYTTFMSGPNFDGIQAFSNGPANVNNWRAIQYDDLTAPSACYIIASYLTDNTTFVPINGATIS